MDNKIQCSNCNSFNVITDSKKKFLTFGLVMLIPGLLLFKPLISAQEKIDGIDGGTEPVILIGFFIVVLILIIGGIVFLSKAIAQKGVTYFCKSCKKLWKS